MLIYIIAAIITYFLIKKVLAWYEDDPYAETDNEDDFESSWFLYD